MNSRFIAEQPLLEVFQNLIDDTPSVVAFTGEKGVGKTAAAQYFSELILKSSLEKHPYFITIDASNSGIDSVRELHKTLALSVPGKEKIKRIVLIDNFEQFGHEAQNALLKTFEEPPIDTLIIITVNKEQKVLPTIWSRVQNIRIPKISEDLALEAFSSHKPDEIKRAYMISGGAAGMLYGLLINTDESQTSTAIEEAKELLKLTKYHRLARIDSITKGKGTPSPVLLDAISRIFYASLIQAAISPSSKYEDIEKRKANLKFSLEAIEDINNGVSEKLALTRFFLAV